LACGAGLQVGRALDESDRADAERGKLHNTNDDNNNNDNDNNDNNN
jgi:hypothetical protein